MAGDPWTGFKFHGPFDTENDALKYAEDHMSHKEFWWIITLEKEV